MGVSKFSKLFYLLGFLVLLLVLVNHFSNTVLLGVLLYLVPGLILMRNCISFALFNIAGVLSSGYIYTTTNNYLFFVISIIFVISFIGCFIKTKRSRRSKNKIQERDEDFNLDIETKKEETPTQKVEFEEDSQRLKTYDINESPSEPISFSERVRVLSEIPHREEEKETKKKKTTRKKATRKKTTKKATKKASTRKRTERKVTKKATKKRSNIRYSRSDISTIEGIGKSNSKKLKDIGIETVGDLLRNSLTNKDRQEVARDSKISKRYIDLWADIADLMRVKGVGEEYSELIYYAGAKRIPELAKFKEDNLIKKMETANKKRKLVRKLPTQRQARSWIRQAKSLPKAIRN